MTYQQQRQNMVQGQLTPNKITNQQILEGFSKIPREMFVGVSNKQIAYTDSYISINHHRTVFPPLVCASLLQAMDIQKADVVLVTASGTAYTTIIIAPMVEKVFAVEEDINLNDIARKNLSDMNINNVILVRLSNERGHLKQAPYDKIIIDDPVEEIPEVLIQQLKNGGKLGCIIKDSNNLFKVVIITKDGNNIHRQDILSSASSSINESFTAPEKFQF